MDKLTALIVGITGQDGSYLAKLLLSKGYKVFGSTRDSSICDTSNLSKLKIIDYVNIISLAPNDFRSVIKAINSTNPDEVYYLAGLTSVGLSFEQPVECMESISLGTLNFLEAIKLNRKNVYISNVVNFRPPMNRRPTEEEIKRYLPFLKNAKYILKTYLKHH